MYFFIVIHPAVFTEIQAQYTVKHNTFMLYNTVLHVSVLQNHHRAP